MLSSTQALLSSIVDYAGLFPPAQLDLQTAMNRYDRAQSSPHHWLLGRFILPASTLQKFQELLLTFSETSSETRPEPYETQWSLSVILTEGWEADLARQASLMQHIHAVEIPPLSPLDIERVLLRLPVGVEAFFEIPLTEDLTPYLKVLKQTGAFAKIRTGGMTIDAFPSVVQLSQCMAAFADAEIPFKATAGLHHPLPAHHPIHYEPDSPSAKMQGFLNVAVAAALLYQQTLLPEDALSVLQESSVEAFQFTSEGIAWRDLHVTVAAIESSRQHFFRSFGSCSFDEPVSGLKELNLI
jgi:hypothetical protein